MIRHAVLAAWHRYSEPLEGRLLHMYLDVKGLVTTGVGNLIDTAHEAQQLPWKRPDGTLATAAEVADEWRYLKSRQDLARLHHRFAAANTRLRLSGRDVDDLVGRKLVSNAAELERWFPEWPTFPADAQLALLSLSWAVGPAFSPKWPNLTQMVLAKDWSGAAECSEIRSTGNPGVVPRNRLQKAHLIAAGSDLAERFPDVLHGPCTLEALDAGWKQAPPITDTSPEVA